jgi:hypothetical protein
MNRLLAEGRERPPAAPALAWPPARLSGHGRLRDLSTWEDVYMAEYEAVEVRATGRTPEAVTAEIGEILKKRSAESWDLQHVQPIIYNSSTTGYLILFFRREAVDG